jgi:flagellar basal-body rod protein FlgB
MAISVSRTSTLAKEALNYRAAREKMIASNIANADTPYYRPRDIRFGEYLAQKKAEIMNDDRGQLQMAQTSENHLDAPKPTNSSKPITFFRDGHMARNDGNSVDLDVETTEMSKNSIMFNALINAIKKDSAIFKSVIDASSKLS